MKSFKILGTAALALLMAGTLAAHEEKDKPKFKASIDVKDAKETAFPGLAKLSFQKAVTIALGEIKGTILEFKAELENENGLIYSIEAKLADGSETEVNIDAGTGKVLEVATETKAQKEKEEQDEKNEKKDHEDKDDKKDSDDK
jgi:uncharacterized membrane protein YkoI